MKLQATATAKPIVLTHRSGQSHLVLGNNNYGKKPKCEVHWRVLYQGTVQINTISEVQGENI